MSIPIPSFRPPIRRILTLGVSLLVAGLIISASALWATASSASAHFVGNGHYVRGVGSENSHGFWLGALETAHNIDDGSPSFCITMWNASPDPTVVATTHTITHSRGDAPANLALTPEEMAYAITTHHAQGGADSRAALAYLAHLNFEMDTPGFDTVASLGKLRDITTQQIPHVATLAEHIATDARQRTPREYVAGEVVSSGHEGTLNGVGARNTNGWTPNIPLSITLEGPAVFRDTGTNQWEGHTADHPRTFAWDATGTGNITAHVTFSQVPRQTLTVASVGGRVQDLLTIADRPEIDPATITHTSNRVEVATRFQPVAKTNVGHARLVDAEVSRDPTAPADEHHGPLTTASAGVDRAALANTPHQTGQAQVGRISDTVTVYLEGGRGTWPTRDGEAAPVVFRGTAYRLKSPLTEPLKTPPTEARIVGTAQITVTGPGAYEAHIDGVEPGFITWVWTMDPKDPEHEYVLDSGQTMADTIAQGWADKYGLSEETSSVRSRVHTDSALSLRHTRSGTYIVDDLYVRGFPNDHGQFTGAPGFEADVPSLRHSLYFFPAGLQVSEGTRAQARLVGSVELPTRNGFHPSIGANEFRILEGNPAGTYVFVTEFAGDARVAPYTSPVDDQHEWHVVPKAAPAQPPQSAQPPASDQAQSDTRQPDKVPKGASQSDQPQFDLRQPGSAPSSGLQAEAPQSQPEPADGAQSDALRGGSDTPSQLQTGTSTPPAQSPESATVQISATTREGATGAQPVRSGLTNAILPTPLAQTGTLGIAVGGALASGLAACGVGTLLMRRMGTRGPQR